MIRRAWTRGTSPVRTAGGLELAPKQNDREARQARERLRAYQARQTVHEHKVKRRKRDNWVAGIAAVVIVALAVGTQLLYFSAGPGMAKASASASASAAPRASPSAAARAAEDPRRGPHVDRHDDDQRHPARRLARRSGRPAGRVVDDLARAEEVLRRPHLPPPHQRRLLRAAVRRPARATAAAARATRTDPSRTPRPTTCTRRAPSPWRGSSDNAESQGSQFFIVYEDTTIPADKAGGYTVIGQVTSGLDDLKSNVTDKGVQGGGTDGKPAVTTTIDTFTLQ